MATSPSPRVILYCHESSPYARKIHNVLAIKKIPYNIVTVSNILPRPEITDLLGIGYRRIPVLAIGNDVYCDTNIITSALEKRFPASQGYGTIFPSSEDGKWTNTGLIKAYSKFYAEGNLFSPALGLMPWKSAFPEGFLKDRGDLRGAPISVEEFAAYAPTAVSTLSTHVSLIEEQLCDGRAYLFHTSGPSLADISAQFILHWARKMPGAEMLFDAAPAVTKTVSTIKSLPEPGVLSGTDAADKIIGASYEPYHEVGFDVTESKRLGVHKGMEVKVTPEDTGRSHPTFGTLVALSKHEITLQITRDGSLHAHFPRIGFNIRSPNDDSELPNFKIL